MNVKELYKMQNTRNTWGNGAVRSYQDTFYHFTSTCNYMLSRQCDGTAEDFSVEIRRSNSTLEHILIQIEGVLISVFNGAIRVKDAL
uniref:VWFD domain-containing protein n=1 Tax=Callorhinchus milii TaxID=7868 RepID=A0A4W3IYP3_CALMI